MKHRWFFGFVVAAVLAAFSWGQAQAVVSTSTTITLPRTGQTTSYAAGDDGALQMGATLPTPRFKDNGDGTVTDNLTGLIWLKNANCIRSHYPSFDNDGTSGDGAVTWQHALDFVAGINSGKYTNCGAGHNDWRLPNIRELRSLTNMAYSGPALSNTAGTGKWSEGDPFTGVQRNYWSSTTKAYSTDAAWSVDLLYGVAFWSGKGGNLYVWPVRGGQSGLFDPSVISQVPRTGQTKCYNSSGAEIGCANTGQDGALQMGAPLPTPRFKDNNDGTVTDNLTGLIWLKNANCFSRTTWSGALAATNGLADGQCGLMDGSHAGDWRLPNETELWSLIDFQYYDPPLSNATGTGQWTEGHPFTGVHPNNYWSSTTNAFYTDGAWHVQLWDGGMDWLGKGNNHYVWPVRGGQSGSFYNLTISKAGTGSGSITATGCTLSWSGNTGTCRASANTSITLHGAAAAGSTWNGWSGGTGSAVVCNGTGDCTFTLGQNSWVTGTFDAVSVTGVCGSANGGVFSAAPSSNLCASGAASAITDSGTAWNWTCYGQNGGRDAACCAVKLNYSCTPSVTISVSNEGVGYNPLPRYRNEVTLKNSIALWYDVQNFQSVSTCRERFLILNAPVLGVNWSYLTAQGQWAPLPQDLGQITPFGCLSDNGRFTIYSGDLPVGDYDLYIGVDTVADGHLNLYDNALVYDHLMLHVVK